MQDQRVAPLTFEHSQAATGIYPIASDLISLFHADLKVYQQKHLKIPNPMTPSHPRHRFTELTSQIHLRLRRDCDNIRPLSTSCHRLPIQRKSPVSQPCPRHSPALHALSSIAVPFHPPHGALHSPAPFQPKSPLRIRRPRRTCSPNPIFTPPTRLPCATLPPHRREVFASTTTPCPRPPSPRLPSVSAATGSTAPLSAVFGPIRRRQEAG